MKKLLSFRHLLLAVMGACSISNAQAQTAINTVYTNSPGYVYMTDPGNAPNWVTFTVKNNNAYPITITGVQFLHVVNLDVGGVFTFSMNGAAYSLVRDPGSITANPAAAATPITNWTHIATSAPFTAPSTGVQPVLTGLSGVATEINPSSEARFAVVVNDSFLVRGGSPGTPPVLIIPAPAVHTITGSGVELLSVDPAGNNQKIYAGLWATPLSYIPNSATMQYGMEGGITFQRKGPSIIVNTNPLCKGETLVLTATLPPGVPSNAQISWTGPKGAGPNTLTWTIPNVQPNDAGQYSVTYKVADQTSAPTTVVVNLKPTPPAPVISGKTAYCINEQFQSPIVQGQNIIWYLTPTGGTGTTIPPYVNTSTSGTYTWYASQTVNGCESDARDTLTITVAPKPAAPIVTTPIGFCEGEPAQPLTAVGDNLRWYDVAFGGLGAILPYTPGTSVQDTQHYWVSQTVMGCEGPRARIDVVITFKPNGLIVPSRDPAVLCQGDSMSFMYYGSGISSTGYNWTVPGGGEVLAPIGNGGQGPLIIRFDSAGVRQVTLVANNLGCNSDLFIQNVKVNPTPYAQVVTPTNACLGDIQTVQLSHYTETVDTFYWNFDGGTLANYSTDQGPYGVIWSTPGTKIVSLTVADELCRSSSADTIEVHALPDARIKSNRSTDAPICTGDTLLLEPMTLVASSNYEWTPSYVFENDAHQAMTHAVVMQNDFLKLKVTDAYGCVNRDSISVMTMPCCKLYFPNAFSPNNDGSNDIFRLMPDGNPSLNSFRIVNRWGQTVFETNDFHRGWDGTLNGEPQDLGVYYFYVKYQCEGKNEEARGEVNLIR